jgi:hypothetical protein
LFLMLALLLAPVLHPMTMAGPTATAGAGQHCHADGIEAADHEGVDAPQHDIDIHPSCAGGSACDGPTILARAGMSKRNTLLRSAANVIPLTGLDILPDPLPPRASF